MGRRPSPKGKGLKKNERELGTLEVLSQPSEIVRKATAVKSAGPITEAKALQLEFWTSFRETLLEKKIVVSAHTPRPQYWFDVSLGRSNIHLSNIANNI